MLQPISGYEEEPVLSLEHVCKSLEDILDEELKQNIVIAKANSAEPEDGLTQDESASIRLYTMKWKKTENSLYAVLNRTLCMANRRKLQPWFKYLKLFLTAFFKLPPTEYQTMWRGVPEDLSTIYPTGKEFTWWGISSCTSSISVLESSKYVGTSGARTMFSIETNSGKLIRSDSDFQEEDEILLPPGIYLKVIDTFSSVNGLHVIHLREISPPYKMLADPFDLNQWQQALPQSKPSSHTTSSRKKEEKYSTTSVTLKPSVQVSSIKGKTGEYGYTPETKNVRY
ncbi:unnamed protein product [Rotaria sp. Silwood1]|nr:unnamed protein product [Rotaria sp. Silwood1]